MVQFPGDLFGDVGVVSCEEMPVEGMCPCLWAGGVPFSEDVLVYGCARCGPGAGGVSDVLERPYTVGGGGLTPPPPSPPPLPMFEAESQNFAKQRVAVVRRWPAQPHPKRQGI